jgi:hypothetical protein
LEASDEQSQVNCSPDLEISRIALANSIKYFCLCEVAFGEAAWEVAEDAAASSSTLSFSDLATLLKLPKSISFSSSLSRFEAMTFVM